MKMLYDDDFIKSLQDDPVGGTIVICERARAVVGGHDGWNEGDYEALAEAFALLVEMSECGLLPFKPAFPALANDFAEDCVTIYQLLEEVLGRCNAEASKLRMQSLSRLLKFDPMSTN
jgi:hypothetical protein